jgi:hypothetical protein
MSWVSEAIHGTDAATFSAFAAVAAAGVALVGATFQFFIGRKQANAALIAAKAALMNAQNSGRHRVAEFRQAWIDKVINALSEYHSIVMTPSFDKEISPNDKRKLSALRTRLEIYLNPEEEDTIALIKLFDVIANSPTSAERSSKDDEMVQVARKLLKKEWERIKTELQ